MKTEETVEVYVSPEVLVVSVEVEQGFAGSSTGEGGIWGD